MRCYYSSASFVITFVSHAGSCICSWFGCISWCFGPSYFGLHLLHGILLCVLFC